MAKLKPDYIEWVLTLNASDAQKEIHKLSEKNKELRDSNKEIKKAMTDLIATGKAGGKPRPESCQTLPVQRRDRRTHGSSL